MRHAPYLNQPNSTHKCVAREVFMLMTSSSGGLSGFDIIVVQLDDAKH